jgi:hypothetical protein
VDKNCYARAVGMLIYLTHSRPDILYAVSILSAQSHAPTLRDFEAVKRCARYIKGSRDLALTFRRGDGDIWLHRYADAAFANHADGRSHTGILVGTAANSAPVFASSKRQTLVALSSTEAELEALKSGCTLCAWLLGLIRDLGYSQLDPVDIFEDNMAAIHLASNKGNWGRTRHYTVRYAYVKSQLENHSIALHYVPTGEQVADILTKPLAKEPFIYLRNIILGLTPSAYVQQFLATRSHTSD